MKFRPQFIALVTILAVAAVFAALVLAGVVSIPAMPDVGFAVLGPTPGSIAENVRNLYELANPGTAIEVVATTEQNGLYKIVLKASDATGTTYKEVYSTKDGKLITESMILVDESIVQMKKLKDFVVCLDSKGVRIAGISNQTATLLQLNLLGTYSPALFVDCAQNIDACIAANITQVPSVVIGQGQYVDSGVKSIDWFERVTGCVLG